MQPRERPASLRKPRALELRNVVLRFGDRTVVDGLTLECQPSEKVALIGPSGAGKTSLLRLASGVLLPNGGEVYSLGQCFANLRGRDRRRLRRRVGMLYQDDNLVPGLRVAHNVLMGRLGHWGTLRALLSLVWPQEIERAEQALRRVELGDRLWEHPDNLSGGQRQRVAIARLIVQEPDLLLADEPASALDPRLGRRVLQLLMDLAQAQQAALIVSLHRLELVDAGFDRVVALRDGRLFWQGTPENFSSDPDLSRRLYQHDPSNHTPPPVHRTGPGRR